MPKRFKLTLIAALAFAAAGSTQAVGLDSAGYAQNFDSLGSSGTTPPAGWSMLIGPTGTSNTTWATTISDSGVAAMVATAGALTAVTGPSANNNNGYNAALAGQTTDRLLATAPTTVSGAAIQLSLTNTTGASFSQLLVSYDTQRFTTATTANQLPGYWLFYSLDGISWTNVAALNPTLVEVPNSVGVSAVRNSLVTLAAPVAVNHAVLLRWVDDNAQQTSPDQIIGLNNVSVSAVPEPAAGLLMLAGLGLLPFASRRRRG